MQEHPLITVLLLLETTVVAVLTPIASITTDRSLSRTPCFLLLKGVYTGQQACHASTTVYIHQERDALKRNLYTSNR